MITVAMFVLFMIGTDVSLICNAVTWGGVSAAPRSCSVGDTITITVTGGVDINEYRYGYRINNTGDYVIFQEWTSSSTSTFVPSSSGSYSFIVYCRDGYSSSNAITLPVDVIGSESSYESSESESSESESSISLPFLPSDWEGGGFVQPSAESTPDLSYEDLPSDLEAFEIDENLTSIIGRAFNAFPQKLIVLMIPTVICLFIGWWLHK